MVGKLGQHRPLKEEYISFRLEDGIRARKEFDSITILKL